MRQRIAARLIRLARRLDPNCCVDFHPLPVGQAVIQIKPVGTVAAMERLQAAHQDAVRHFDAAARRS